MNADQVAPRPLAVKRRNEDHQRPMASKIVAVLPLLSRFGGKATRSLSVAGPTWSSTFSLLHSFKRLLVRNDRCANQHLLGAP
jgi:hypothetical protein